MQRWHVLAHPDRDRILATCRIGSNTYNDLHAMHLVAMLGHDPSVLLVATGKVSTILPRGGAQT
jgi:hypothetical protein